MMMMMMMMMMKFAGNRNVAYISASTNPLIATLLRSLVAVCYVRCCIDFMWL